MASNGPAPDFLGIGAPNAGNVWLAEMLNRHPMVQFPTVNGRKVRESGFWNDRRGRGIGWWRALFAKADPATRAGEVAPMCAMLDAESIREIHALNPALKLIYVLRNPIDRAWVQAVRLARRRQLDPEALPDSWYVEAMRTHEAQASGDYAASLHTWSTVFPAQSLIVAEFESGRSNPRDFLSAVCRHIGVSGQPLRDLPDAVLNQRNEPAGPRPSLIPLLRELCAPRIDDLSKLLRQDFARWREAYEAPDPRRDRLGELS